MSRALATGPRHQAGPDRELLLERAIGALLGQACGDAFGMPNSYLLRPRWRTGMEQAPRASRFHAGLTAGQITDDTQHSLAITAAYAAGEGCLDAALVADELERWLQSQGGPSFPAMGNASRRGLDELRSGTPLAVSGIRGVTNGAAMRVPVVGVRSALVGGSFDALLRDVYRSCVPTHHTSVAISGAAAVAAAVWSGVRGDDWRTTRAFAKRGADAGARLGRWLYAPSVSSRIASACEAVERAEREEHAARILADVVGTGESTTDSVPAAFAAAHYANRDPAVAIRVAGNSGGDTDTIASIAGAIAGARAGSSRIPGPWRERVEVCNGIDFEEWAYALSRECSLSGGDR